MSTMLETGFDWRAKWRDRLTSARAAVKHIRPGDDIYLSAGSAVPSALLDAMVAPGAVPGDHLVYHLLTLGDAPYVQDGLATQFRHNALFIGPNVRPAVTAGRADYTPVFLSEIPSLIRRGRLSIEVAILTCAPPDQKGFLNFGTHVDLAPAVCDVVRTILVEINPQMPRVPSPYRLHVERVAAMVECSRPLPELRHGKDKPEAPDIARHIAELVPDGATLQLGIGGIPDGVLRYLRDRNDLGVHSEMFSDGVMELVKCGVITCRRKSLHAGKIIASFVLGTRAVYDWLDGNALVELHPVDYTNDPVVIAQNDNMVAINTCLQIDLTGQVCSDSLGERFYSGIGGQVDFIRGAARSRGGKPIIALPSTAANGVISRIVPRLDDGAGVVTTRGDVHWVVTEHGAVNLHGLNVRERAMSLISIAHPKFRSWLLAEAKARKLVYLDQAEPPPEALRYPEELISHAKTVDGAPLVIRPVKPTDESLLRELFYRLSSETIYNRFFNLRRVMPHAQLQRYCNVDHDQDVVLVATVSPDEVESVVGTASYHLDPTTGFAEIGLLIDDAWQARGVPERLRDRMIDIARQRRLKGLVAVALSSNLSLQKLIEQAGPRVEITPQGETIEMRLLLDPNGTD